MEILTASYRALGPGNGQPVVSSLGLPRFRPDAHTWPRLREATPHGAYFHAEPDVFAEKYVRQLQRHGIGRIRARLEELAAETGATRLLVCCFEASRDDCHRDLFAEWWREQTGEELAELEEAAVPLT